MPTQRPRKPADFVMSVSAELEMFARNPGVFDAEHRERLLIDAGEAMFHLRQVRNMVRAISELEQPATQAVQPYL